MLQLYVGYIPKITHPKVGSTVTPAWIKSEWCTRVSLTPGGGRGHQGN